MTNPLIKWMGVAFHKSERQLCNHMYVQLASYVYALEKEGDTFVNS